MVAPGASPAPRKKRGSSRGKQPEDTKRAPADKPEATDLEKVLERLEHLESRLERFEKEERPPASTRTPTHPPAHQPTQDPPQAAPRAPAPPEPARAETGAWRVLPDRPGSEPTQAEAGAAVPGPSPGMGDEPVRPEPRKRDLEELLGADWLAKAGVAVVALGIVFLFQYAVAQGWLTLTLQVVLGFLFGLVLFAVGDFLFVRRRLLVYGQILAGGGAAISYFSVFASYVFPEYRTATGVSLELVAVLLGTLAVGMLVYGVLRRTPVLVSVAMVMGAVTVVFAGQWPAFAAVYVLLLTVAVMGVGAWRNWEYVVVVALVASFSSLLVGRAFGLEALVAMWSAFGVGVAALAVSVWMDREPLALGFLPATALIIGITGGRVPDTVVIAAGIAGLVGAAAATYRRWPNLSFVALAATYMLLFVMSMVGFALFEDAQASSFAVLLLVTSGLIGIVYSATLWWSSRKGLGGTEPGMVAGAGGFAVLGAWGLVVFALENAGWGVGTGWVTLGLAVVALGLAALPFSHPAMRYAWLASGIVLALAWPPILLGDVPMTLVWTVYLAASGLFLFHRPGTVVRVCMGLSGGLALFFLLFVHWPALMRDTMPWGEGLALFISATAAFLLAWAGERRTGDESTEAISWSLLAAALLLPILYLATVLEGFLVSVAWAAEALLLVVVGFIAKMRELRLAGLAVFGLVLFRLLVFDMQAVDPGLRIVTFILVGVIALLAAYFFARRIKATKEETGGSDETVEG